MPTDKSPQLTSEERAALSRLGRYRALRRWSQVDDRTAATAPGRQASNARFEKEVDPEGVLDPRERAIRAEKARQAHFVWMAHRSVAARKKRAGRAAQPPDAA